MEKKSLNKQNSPHKKGSFKPDSLSTEVRNVLKITTENFSFHVKMNQNIHSEWHKDSRFEVRTKETIPGWWINTSSRRSSWKSIIQRRWKMKSVKFFSKQKLQVDECPSPKVLTWGSLSDSGSAWEITAPLSLTLFLVIAIHSIVTVILYSVRVVTDTILNDRSTVSSSSTSIIQWLLKGLVTEPIFAYTICSTYRRKNEKYL